VLHGESVFGYHVVNFVIHYLTGIFLFFWLRLLPVVKNDELKKNWFPAVVALFFLLHPVQTQSVTYIIQRMTSLSGLCLILSVFLYTKGRFKHIETANIKSVIHYYFLSLFFGVLGVLSKQPAAVFPVILLLIELFFVRSKEGKIFRSYLIAVFSIGLLAIVTLLFTMGLPAETTSVSRVEYFATQLIVIPRYFQMMLIPVGMNIDHGVKFVDSLFNTWSILGFLFLLATLIYGFFMLKKEPLILFGLLWIFVTLFIESSIFPITDPMFDHRMYLPLVGFGMALWSIVNRYVFSKSFKLQRPVIVGVLLLLSISTIARNSVWNSRVAIWTSVTESYPDHLRGWMALGKMYLNDDEKDVRKSIECFEKARSINPELEENLMDLAFSYMLTRQEDKAIACYEKLKTAKNREYREQAIKVLSAYYVSKGNIDDAATYLRNDLKLQPNDSETWKRLFALYFDKKEFQKAFDIAREWTETMPKNADAMYYMAKSQFQLRDKEMAEQYLLRSLRIAPNHADAMMLYANIMVNRFEFDEAIVMLEKAYAIDKNSKIPENIELIKQLKAKAPKP
jgi:cytochrome c-type biogenesis protein CcmH/NrfG